jgi:hypothetical protein
MVGGGHKSYAENAGTAAIFEGILQGIFLDFKGCAGAAFRYSGWLFTNQ